MDVIKTVLIVCIAVVLYYLLMQWPTQARSPEKIDEVTFNDMISNDSEDLLSPPESPVLEAPTPRGVETPIASFGKVFVLENDTFFIEIDASSGKFISSKLKHIKTSKDGTTNFGIFGFKGENFYSSNSGFFNTQGYLQPGLLKLVPMQANKALKSMSLKGPLMVLFLQEKLILVLENII